MLVELSPVAYLTLCGLVRDALEVSSDASFLLQKVAKELSNVTVDEDSEFSEQPDRVEALRRGGFMAG